MKCLGGHWKLLFLDFLASKQRNFGISAAFRGILILFQPKDLADKMAKDDSNWFLGHFVGKSGTYPIYNYFIEI